MRCRTSFPAAATVLVVLLAAASGASANAAAPTTYETSVDGTDVTVCPRNFDGRGCHAGDVLLRHNVDTGETVVIDTNNCSSGDVCQQAPSGDAGSSDAGAGNCCYTDSCAPEGTYQYGFATPYACSQSSASTHYYTEVTVPADAPRACQPPSRETYEDELPWEGTGRVLCRYEGDAGPGTGGDAAMDAGGTSEEGGNSGGCSVTGQPSRHLGLILVFLFNALAFAGGGLARRFTGRER